MRAQPSEAEIQIPLLNRLHLLCGWSRFFLRHHVSAETEKTTDAIARLCTACGLCCNGVLFGDVELQRSDDGKKLSAVGLQLFRKGRKQAFHQPCACFDGQLCGIYTNRPKRCAAFECGLLKRVISGRMSSAAALKIIRTMQSRVDGTKQILRELGNHEESTALNKRYAAVMAQPIDLSADEADAGRRGELMMAVSGLMSLAQREFLTS
jgi:hypothetical protein